MKGDHTQSRRTVRSGEWESHQLMKDYRAEWLSDLLVERATWRRDAPEMQLDGIQVSGPSFVWFRFWLPEPGQVAEKYFDAGGESLGIYMPITSQVERVGDHNEAHHLLLGLWCTPGGRLTVVGEEAFEEAASREQLTSGEVEWAESRIRELTTAINRDRQPPALIRNFAIDVKKQV